MYKDKDKQREANRNAQAKQRAKRITEGMTGLIKGVTQSMTKLGMTPNKPEGMTEPKRGKDIKCFADLPTDVQETINKMARYTNGTVNEADKARRTAAAIKYQHLFPESYDPNHFIDVGNIVTGKPGDADYNGVCTEAWRAERGR